MRPGVKKLIEDAKGEGYNVYQKGNVWYVFKNKHTGLSFWPDGTAIRADTDLTVCKAIRTIKEMRNALSL